MNWAGRTWNTVPPRPRASALRGFHCISASVVKRGRRLICSWASVVYAAKVFLFNHRLGVGREQPHFFHYLAIVRKHFRTMCRLVGMEYRCEATSVAGFIQQLVSCYLPHGYWFYVSGIVPIGKDPRGVDEKLLAKYGIGVSRQSRARRKLVGIANVHYIRYQRRFLLLATHGHHLFFDDEEKNIRDARRVPIKFAGYSISVAKGGFKGKHSTGGVLVPDDKWRVRVQIEKEWYLGLKAYLLDIAPHRSADWLAAELYNLPFEPYAPVRRQLLNLIRHINQRRKTAGLELLRFSVLRFQRKIVRPFEPFQELPEPVFKIAKG